MSHSQCPRILQSYNILYICMRSNLSESANKTPWKWRKSKDVRIGYFTDNLAVACASLLYQFGEQSKLGNALMPWKIMAAYCFHSVRSFLHSVRLSFPFVVLLDAFLILFRNVLISSTAPVISSYLRSVNWTFSFLCIMEIFTYYPAFLHCDFHFPWINVYLIFHFTPDVMNLHDFGENFRKLSPDFMFFKNIQAIEEAEIWNLHRI